MIICKATYTARQGHHPAVKHECVRSEKHEGNHVCSCGTEWHVGKHVPGDELRKGPVNCG